HRDSCEAQDRHHGERRRSNLHQINQCRQYRNILRASRSPSMIRFPDIGGSTLEKIVKYLHYKDKYSNSTSRIPEFQIDPDEALELLVAANYLNC
ncbi:hypothetical protein HJC23_014033, partial [Cyclotella cryptica]